MKFRSALLYTITAAALAAPAHATVVSGQVTGGYSFNNGGVFEKLDPSTGFSVGNNNFQSLNLFAFDEDQNIVVSDTVKVNIGTAPVAGDTVASHYVFFDPAGNNLRSQKGWVEFDADIYGIATGKNKLDNSDYLANTNVNYISKNLRGLESGDKVKIDPTNAKRLLIDWDADTPGDYIRVFTKKSPMAAQVPLPATAPLLFGAVAVFAALRRRRKG